MKKNEDLQKVVQHSIKVESVMNKTETDVLTKIYRRSNKFIWLISIAGMGLFLNSCVAGYVATEPSYIENSRPDRPSNLHVWIDGDWVWSNRTKVYVRNNGYWSKPSRGRTYIAGHWQSSPRGSRWVPGHWQGHGRMMNHVN